MALVRLWARINGGDPSRVALVASDWRASTQHVLRTDWSTLLDGHSCQAIKLDLEEK